MKILFLLYILSSSFVGLAQEYSAETILLNKEELKFYPQFSSYYLPFSKLNSSSFYYWPQKAQGLNVIYSNLQGSNLDYVYYIDKAGNTEHRSMMMTKPVNVMFQNQRRLDSLNPYGSQSFGEAVVNGIATMIFTGLH